MMAYFSQSIQNVFVLDCPTYCLPTGQRYRYRTHPPIVRINKKCLRRRRRNRKMILIFFVSVCNLISKCSTIGMYNSSIELTRNS